MKRLTLASLSLLLPLAMNAQIVRGDMDGNGKLTITDITLLVNTVMGCTPAEEIKIEDLVSTDLLAGTWYLTKTQTVNFAADGTTTYTGATHYKFLPSLGYIILTDAKGYASSILNVTKLDEAELCINGATTYTRQAPLTPVAAIVLSTNDVKLFPAESVQLAATVLPADADNKALVWTTSDPKVATVTDGVVKAVAIGTATITCTAADGSGVKTTCTVTVTPQGLPGTQVGEGSGA